jgi:hypothetical protein
LKAKPVEFCRNQDIVLSEDAPRRKSKRNGCTLSLAEPQFSTGCPVGSSDSKALDESPDIAAYL